MSAGVYAGMILTVPQLFRKVKLFTQSPVINGGYDQTTPYTDARVILKDDSSGVKDQHGNWVRTKRKSIWSRIEIQPGSFMLHEDTVYRVMTDQSWETQAGFFTYGIEKVIGDSGTPTFKPAANDGRADF